MKSSQIKGYRAVRGARLSDEQAQLYGERISDIIEQNDGVVSPDNIVQDAAKKNSPLHEYFEWDDSLAARHYRLEQAKYLLRTINVIVKVKGEEQEIRAFHSVVVQVGELSASRNYTPLVRVMNDSTLRTQVVAQALSELKQWQKRYQQYQELSAVFAAIEEVQAS